MEQRPDNCRSHSRCGKQHASPGRIRMRESLQSKDKQDGSSEVTELDVDIHFEFPFFPAGFTGRSRLIIFNLLPVIMNPPITLIKAEITSVKPSNLAAAL